MLQKQIIKPTIYKKKQVQIYVGNFAFHSNNEKSFKKLMKNQENLYKTVDK
jgi:hypothetical protein